MKSIKTCAIDGCDQPFRARGFCMQHYMQARGRGQVEAHPRLSTDEALAVGLVRMPSGCLEWTGSKINSYGRIQVSGKTVLTHRYAWTLVNGPVPDGMKVLHHCDNPPCCETEPSVAFPEGHLFLGTQAENVADMVAKGRQRGRPKSLTKHELTDQRDEALATIARITRLLDEASPLHRSLVAAIRDSLGRVA